MNKYKTYLPTYGADKKVAYFSMEYAIDQALKIYAGGLGFLSGSHLRSSYSLKKDLVGIGILWKYGYYDQIRDENQNMKVAFTRKTYSFLEDIGIKFQIKVNNAPVWVKAFCLPPDVFNTSPLYLLTTDLEENDYLARSIVDKLYAPNEATRIAQSILLGIGGGKLLELLGFEPDVYHLNEGHGLPLAFHLLEKYGSVEAVKSRLVFTTHTPEKAGNEERSFQLLHKMSFFGAISPDTVKKVTGTSSDSFNYTLAALKLSGAANGVSKIHGKVSNQMWDKSLGIPQIISITNAQNREYWMDKKLADEWKANNNEGILARKKALKKELFEVVADQTGKIFDTDTLTIVWSRRFAGYKRADLILRDFSRFEKLLSHPAGPVQIIFAGKPYPEDYPGIEQFNHVASLIAPFKNCAILTGYELNLSALLKKGSDVWLNTPRYPREASGTSGMTAAMNGSLNLSVADGWFPEFAQNGENGFVIPVSDSLEYLNSQDKIDHERLMDILENQVVPTYYTDKPKWTRMIKKSIEGVYNQFDSERMVNEYFEKLYSR